jgi:tricorn protease
MVGYYQKPAVHGDNLVFVCEDDLWWVGLEGGIAERLTASPGRCSDPVFSPDGKAIAYTGRDEGYNEVHILDLETGSPQRLTYLGADTRVVAFSPDGAEIYFTTNSWQAFGRFFVVGKVAREGGVATQLPYGPASWIAFEQNGPGRVLGRHTWDTARWKRYRGGTVGQFWIDRNGAEEWRSLRPAAAGNLTRPLWLGDRLYFGSDHEEFGDLYSCTPDGDDLRCHSHHEDFYLRHPASDGRTLVYQAGARIYRLDLASDQVQMVPIELRAGGFARLRRFVAGGTYLDSYDLHPRGQAIACTVRGKALAFYPHEQPVYRLGQPQGVRYRLATWLSEGEEIVVVSDQEGEERLEVYDWKGGDPQIVKANENLGRALHIEACPNAPYVALTNHRFELWIVHLNSGESHCIERNLHDRIAGMSWSPCGCYLAYGSPTGRLTSMLKIVHRNTHETVSITEGSFRDVAPSWDPLGRYLYFLSLRIFNPVWDNLFFEMSFPMGMRPYLITLQDDLANPFELDPSRSSSIKEPDKKTRRGKKPEEPIATRIDFDGITQRIVAFPVDEGRYGRVVGCGDTVLFSHYPVEGTLDQDLPGSPPGSGTLISFDLKTLEEKELYYRVSSFAASADGKWVCYRSGQKLRVVSLDKKPESSNEENPGRKTGWVSQQRLRVSVEPLAEWRQMAREAWRLMREHFWDPAMSGYDWEAIYQRYQPLLDRVGSRSELSDWMWELQGELGTSHAYESGGDYGDEPFYPQGKLAMGWSWDEQTRGYRVDHLVAGDCWDPNFNSPGLRLGNPLQVGDVVTHIQNVRVRKDQAPEAHLVYCARQDVPLRVLRNGKTLHIHVKPLRSELNVRYRAWVQRNRNYVHEASGGRVGYLHVPNMGPFGFSEFHRGYYSEVQRQGLIVDVRYNGGGNVSGLLLEKLSRRVVGWDVPRYGQPMSYPLEAPTGPMVAITNEMAGSDGDIFSHCFKLLNLGPLVGTRTWGGVIGIWPRHKLVDGTSTTQPEFAFWFEDVGWRVENYGTEPDHTVEIAPQDWMAGRDPQLEKALQLVVERLLDKPARPEFGGRPRLARPSK